ncbi:MAG TPA: hypothetical protein VK689_20160 [Armatimonadota bacterium]|nr:hypothetical protein [Armatimonadota bacterium]
MRFTALTGVVIAALLTTTGTATPARAAWSANNIQVSTVVDEAVSTGSGIVSGTDSVSKGNTNATSVSDYGTPASTAGRIKKTYTRQYVKGNVADTARDVTANLSMTALSEGIAYQGGTGTADSEGTGALGNDGQAVAGAFGHAWTINGGGVGRGSATATRTFTLSATTTITTSNQSQTSASSNGGAKTKGTASTMVNYGAVAP